MSDKLISLKRLPRLIEDPPNHLDLAKGFSAHQLPQLFEDLARQHFFGSPSVQFSRRSCGACSPRRDHPCHRSPRKSST
jgi:hypothetical protein